MNRRGALIGFGHIAERAHVAALLQAGCTITAVVETSQARCEAARAALPQATVFASVADMLAHADIDFVDICTPPHLHFIAAQQAIEAGCHVLCEKPLVLDLEHAQALWRLAKKHDVVVTCMHNWTQAPILRRALTLVTKRTLGPLRHMQLTTWRTAPAAAAAHAQNWRTDPTQAGGGILFDHGWHAMSLILRAANSVPHQVRGAISRQQHHGLLVEDTCQTNITLASGATARFDGTWAAPKRRSAVHFTCAHGEIQVENGTLTVLQPDAAPAIETFAESLADGGYRPHWTAAIVQEFFAEIDGSTPRGTGLQEAMRCLRLLVATYESALVGGNEIYLTKPADPRWREALQLLDHRGV